MKTVSVREVTSQLPALLALVQQGQEVVIANDAGPVARLCGIAASHLGRHQSEPDGAGDLVAAGRVPELSRVSPELRADFHRLAEEWSTATQFVSSLTDMVTHPAYQRIIGMGIAAIPLLLEQLQRKPNHWFWALKAITGEDPVTDEIRGDVKAMTKVWLTWGRRNGYC